MTTLAFIQNISSSDLILVVCVILLFVGAKRLPNLIRSVKQSGSEFKSAKSEDDSNTLDDK